MIRPSRESIYGALFALLETLPGLSTVSRRLVNVQDIQPEEFPAAFQLQGDQITQYKGSTPYINTWKASWILNAYQTDPDIAPSTALNQLIDASIALITPPPGITAFTLGGLATHVAVDGTIQVFEGVLGDRALAIVPISIVLPGF